MGLCSRSSLVGNPSPNPRNVGITTYARIQIERGEVFAFEMRYCDSPHLLYLERPKTANGATVADYNLEFASLITGPEFGCVNFEAEPPTT